MKMENMGCLLLTEASANNKVVETTDIKLD